MSDIFFKYKDALLATGVVSLASTVYAYRRRWNVPFRVRPALAPVERLNYASELRSQERRGSCTLRLDALFSSPLPPPPSLPLHRWAT